MEKVHMSLINQIKEDQFQARKDRNIIKINLLTTLLGDIQIVGKNNGNRETTDKEAIAIIKKFIKNAKDTLKVRKDQNIVIELELLENYLPQQLTNDELTLLIQTFIDREIPNVSMKNLGQIMKHLNVEHGGTFDGKNASSLIKSILTEKYLLSNSKKTV